MNWHQRTFAVVAVLLYVGVAAMLLYFAYEIFPSAANTDQYKEFGVRAGLALTGAAGVIAPIISFFTLNAQIRAARDLEDKKGEIVVSLEQRKEEIIKRVEEYKGEILKSVEERKADIVKEIEQVKGNIARQNDFLTQALDVKSASYQKLFVATNKCYRELQNLERGLFNKQKLEQAETELREAEALGADLDDEDTAIVNEIVQNIFNIIGEAERETQAGEELKNAYKDIWNKHALEFGEALNKLRQRSLFRNKKLAAP